MNLKKLFSGIALVAGLGLAAPVAAAHDSSYHCTGPIITAPMPTNPYTQYRSPVAADFTTVDARGKWYRARNSSNPNADAQDQSYAGVGALPREAYPFRNGSAAAHQCFQGGRVVGEMSLTAHRWSPYSNAACLLLDGTTREITAEGWRLDRCWDGVKLPYTICRDTPGNCHNVIRDTWISGVRDDAIENDGLGGLLIENVLMDGVFAGVSADPGCSTPTTCTTTHRGFDAIVLRDVLMRLEGFPSYSNRGTNPYHVGPLKLLAGFAPDVELYHTTIAFEYFQHPDQPAPGRISTLSHWSTGWSHVTRCEGNRLLYMQEPNPNRPDGLPDNFPALPNDSVTGLPCFTVVTGLAARNEWSASKATWVQAHPDIERIDGDLR